MGTTAEFVEYVTARVAGLGEIASRKMFGEYMVYVNAKPILLVCDNVVYVKMYPELKALMQNAPTGAPYNGAKPHYMLDIDDNVLCKEAIRIIEPLAQVPKKRKKKEKYSEIT